MQASKTLMLCSTADSPWQCQQFQFPGSQTVLMSCYVDDCLKSVTTVEDGISLSTELREITQKGGFCMTRLVSISPEVIGSNPDSEHLKNLKNIDFDCDAFPSLEGRYTKGKYRHPRPIPEGWLTTQVVFNSRYRLQAVIHIAWHQDCLAAWALELLALSRAILCRA